MARRAAHRTSRHPSFVPAGTCWAGEDQCQQPGLQQRGQAERRGSAHGLHCPGDQEQDDVLGEGRHVHPQPTLWLRFAVHKPGESPHHAVRWCLGKEMFLWWVFVPRYLKGRKPDGCLMSLIDLTRNLKDSIPAAHYKHALILNDTTSASLSFF